MKVVFITYHYLHGFGGGVYASRAYINAFAEISNEITLLYPQREGAEPVGINSKVNKIPVYDRRSRLRKGLDLLFGRSNRYRDINRIIGVEEFDLVVFDTCMVSHGIINYFKNKEVRIITIHHNYQYEYFRDNSKGFLKYVTLFWTRRFELEAIRNSDLNLTLTEDDKLSLQKYYDVGRANFEVIGAFEYERIRHEIYPDVEEDRFIITGNLGSLQTVNSLIEWIKEYYTVLKEVFPDAILTIAGKSPSIKLLNLADDNKIKVIPSPEAMESILANSKYYISPIALGSGLKLRLMDGLSKGIPVICHSVSARGYDNFVDKGVILKYEDKESFRLQLEKLRSLNFSRKAIVELYEKSFSFKSGLDRLRQSLQNAGISDNR